MLSDQLALDLNAELIVDNFAGGGGASTGIERALGRCVDIAINHDRDALAMHQANHPQTLHLPEDVFAIDPVKVTKGRPVGLAWFSPDCKHHSKAKGGKPKDKRIRGLAWVTLHWVNRVQPRIIMLENVEEFQHWCPLDAEGKQKKHLKGWTFQCFKGALERRGYVVEHRELRACDYGAPTIRKRLFLIARRDGKPIVWPEPTHGAPDSPEVKAGKLKPWRTAAECIDWSILCPSIFERKKPLADNTCKRIAKGIMRYVVKAAEPFIVPFGYDVKVKSAGGFEYEQAPFSVSTNHGDSGGRREYPMDEPMRTVVASSRGGEAVVAPVLTEHANAGNQRVFDPQEPLRTQCAEVKGGHFALVEAFLAKHYTGVVGSDLKDPIGSVTATDHHSLVSAHLARHFGQSVGQECDKPAPTVTADGQGKTAVVASHLAKMRGNPDTHPVGKDHRQPIDTISAQGNHFAEVRAFLVKYYGSEQHGAKASDPMHTVRTGDCFGLVLIKGIAYAIIDIGLRMLQPKELFAAQGFPADYIHDRGLYRIDNKWVWRALTKTAQVRMCGNSVCPPLAEALVKANAPDMAVKQEAAA